MPILNYTTTISAQKTVSEIIGLLARKGAQSITQDFRGDGTVSAVSFMLKVAERPQWFALPANIDGVAGVLKKDKPYTPRSTGTMDQYYFSQRQQAEKIAWRILKDWVEAQIALIESGQAEPAQIFMPYATDVNGQTLFQHWMEGLQKQLPSGV